MIALSYFGPAGLVSRCGMFSLFDPSGNTAASYYLDAGGTGVSSVCVYDAFGQVKSTAGTGPSGFAGQWGGYTDYETGLVLLGHRYYDPNTGRFLTRDPMGTAETLPMPNGSGPTT